MIIIKRSGFFTNCTLCNLGRFSTANQTHIATHLKYTPEEQDKILHTLNNYNVEQLSRYDITQGRIKHLENWKISEGPFKNFPEIFKVNGLAIKVLERLCDSIINNTNLIKNTKPARRQYLVPPLTNEMEIESAVGFRLGTTGISWAKLCVEGNCLQNWHFINFSGNATKKMLPSDNFKLAQQILNEIPSGSVYIFEASPNMSPQTNKQASMILSYNQQLELAAMLYALINTSEKHNYFMNNGSNQALNVVYHIKGNLAARLFKTLVGSERVSSTVSVSKILQKDPESLQSFTVDVEKSLQHQYNMQSAVIRELLGQALLLIVTFLDICVYKNPSSVEAVMPGRR